MRIMIILNLILTWHKVDLAAASSAGSYFPGQNCYPDSHLHYSARSTRVCARARVYIRTPTKWQALSDSRDLDSRVMYMRGRGNSKDQIIAPRRDVEVEDGTETRRGRETPRSHFLSLFASFYTYLRAVRLFFSPSILQRVLILSVVFHCLSDDRWACSRTKSWAADTHPPSVLVVILCPHHLHKFGLGWKLSSTAFYLWIFVYAFSRNRYFWPISRVS